MSEEYNNNLIPQNSETDGFVRSSKFTKNNLKSKSLMVWEENNSLATSYQNMTHSEKSLLIAGLVTAHAINSVEPFSTEELQSGIKISVPIGQVAEMMGYELTKDGDNKSHYKVIKNASLGLRKTTFVKETITKTGVRSFDTFGLIDRIKYNENGNGQIIFFFSGGASDLIINQSKDFTLYSLILRNRIEKTGQNGTTRLHEILKTSLYKAESNPQGKVDVYYDFVDLRLKLGFIRSDEEAVKHILNDKQYMSIEDDSIAYARMKALEAVDEPIKREIRKFKASDEYRNTDKTDKEAMERRRNKLKLLNDRIVCNYNTWGDFRKRVLIPSQKTFLGAVRDYPDLMNFTFEYENKTYKGETIGVLFTIYTVEAYKRKELEDGTQMSIFEYIDKPSAPVDMTIYDSVGDAVKGDEPIKKSRVRRTKEQIFEQTLNDFSKYVAEHPSENALSVMDIYNLAKEYDYKTLARNYDLLVVQTGIREPVKWLWKACEENYAATKKVAPVKKTQFHNIEQHEYDFDELEEKLLNRGVEM